MQGHRLVRRASVSAGTMDWEAAASSQWAVFPNDDLATLGVHVFERGRCEYVTSGCTLGPGGLGGQLRASVVWQRLPHAFTVMEVVDGGCEGGGIGGEGGGGPTCPRSVRTSLSRAQHSCMLLPAGQGGAGTGDGDGANGPQGDEGIPSATPMFASALVLGGLTHMPALHDAVYRYDLASGTWSLLAAGNSSSSSSTNGTGDGSGVGGAGGQASPTGAGIPLRTGHAMAGPFGDWVLVFGGEGYAVSDASDTRAPEGLPGSTLRRPPRERAAPPVHDVYRGQRVGVANDLWALQVATGEWAVVDAGAASDAWPLARTDAAMVMLGDDAWVFGGISAEGMALSDIWSYNVSAFLANQAAGADTGDGGNGGDGGDGMATTLWAYAGPLDNPDGARWPQGRWQHSAVVLDTFWGARVLLFGGFDGSGDALDDLWEFDAATGALRPLAPCPGGGRGDHVAVAVNADTMAIMGGASASMHGALANDLWLYHYWDDKWEELHSSRPSGTLGGLPVGWEPGGSGAGVAAEGAAFYPHVRRGHCAIPLHRYEPPGCAANSGSDGSQFQESSGDAPSPSALCNITSWQATVTGMLVFGGQPYWGDQHYLEDVWAVDFTSLVYPPPAPRDDDSFYGTAFYGLDGLNGLDGLGFYGMDASSYTGHAAALGAKGTRDSSIFDGVHRMYPALQGGGVLSHKTGMGDGDLLSPFGFHVTE
eukprot:jgi/Mesvir1/16684/Mv15083-RA.3